MTLAEFGTGEVFWSMVWFFLFFIWIWLLFLVFGDIFRSHDVAGARRCGRSSSSSCRISGCSCT